MIVKIKMNKFISWIENTLKSKVVEIKYDDKFNSILFFTENNKCIELRLLGRILIMYYYEVLNNKQLEFIFSVSDSNITRLKKKFAKALKGDKTVINEVIII